MDHGIIQLGGEVQRSCVCREVAGGKAGMQGNGAPASAQAGCLMGVKPATGMTLRGSSASQGTAGTHPVRQKVVVIWTRDSAGMEWASPHVDRGAKAHTEAGTSWIKLTRSGSCVVGIERATSPWCPLNLTWTLIQCIPQERRRSDTRSLCTGYRQDSLDPADTWQ